MFMWRTSLYFSMENFRVQSLDSFSPTIILDFYINVLELVWKHKYESTDSTFAIILWFVFLNYNILRHKI